MLQQKPRFNSCWHYALYFFIVFWPLIISHSCYWRARLLRTRFAASNVPHEMRSAVQFQHGVFLLRPGHGRWYLKTRFLYRLTVNHISVVHLLETINSSWTQWDDCRKTTEVSGQVHISILFRKVRLSYVTYSCMESLKFNGVAGVRHMTNERLC